MISLKGYFAESNSLMKFLVLAFLLLFSLLVLSLLMFFEAFVLRIPFSEVPHIVNGEDASGIGFLRLVQITQHVVVFLIPALFTAYLISPSGKSYLKVDAPKNPGFYVLSVFILVSAIPFVNYLSYLNVNYQFPNWLKGFELWAKDKETFANELVGMFFVNKSLFTLMINVFMMALVPAIAEEFLFRGLIQQMLIKSVKNIHVGIFITAVIFSAMHMQFLGFLPRLFLGMVLGYLFVWTGSIWISVLAHFTNNFLGVMALHYLNEQQNTGMENIGTPDGLFMAILPATIVFAGLTYMLYLRRIDLRN